MNIRIECKSKDLQAEITKAFNNEAETVERTAMQGWLEDAFAFKGGGLDYLTDMEIRSRVEIHYDGGLTQFRSDGECQ